MSSSLPELSDPAGPPKLTDALRASEVEVRTISRAIDAWLRRSDVDLNTRLHGMAWVAESLGSATLENVRDARFKELIELLFSVLPGELDLQPVEAPSTRQSRMLRQAVFARVEDPKLYAIARRSRWATVLDQLKRSRRLMRGRGPSPSIGAGWKPVDLERVEDIHPCDDDGGTASIDNLMTRYVRATVLGQRCWGAGYYGWSVVAGLQAMMLNVAAIGWLSRLHAAGHGRGAVSLDDVSAALSRVDRTSGRAPWLGSGAERLRLTYLRQDNGLRRIVEGNPLLMSPMQADAMLEHVTRPSS